MPPFERFGIAHSVALLALGLGVIGAHLGARRWPRATAATLAAVLVGGMAAHLAGIAARRELTVFDLLPLHLCDMSIFLSLAGLVWPHRRLVELLFFWTTTGTLLACITPALRHGPPSLGFFTYFALHGGVIAAALYLATRQRLTLDLRAALRAWAWTNVYAAGVLFVDVLYGRNYLYLTRAPPVPTLLDALGPWPNYLFVAEGIALVSFALVATLWRTGAHARTDGPLLERTAPLRTSRSI